MRAFLAVVVGLGLIVSCKKGDPAAAQRCRETCSYLARSSAEMAKDLEDADRVASALANIQVKDDSEIRQAGESARSGCARIREGLSHARGISWAIASSKGLRSLGVESGPILDSDDFSRVLKDTEKCAEHSPAQIKTDVAGVKALREKGVKVDEARCSSSCASTAS